MDIRGLTLQITAQNIRGEGRFYILWRDNNFIIIQAESWWRSGFVPDNTTPLWHYQEERRALWHLQEVIQTMLDTIVFDGGHNWAHLVRLKNGTYHLAYMKRQLIHNCPMWTKVVELDDIEMTRLVWGECWEGIYQGEEVDIFIAWRDLWGCYVSDESRGQKLVESRGLGHYFFELKAHICKNGVLVGMMREALVGRGVSPSDRPAVFEALADIQRHGIFIYFDLADVYITERGVRFASASTARYYPDSDALAERASVTWKMLVKAFNDLDGNFSTRCLRGSRSICSNALIIPRLPSPGRPMTLTPEEAMVRWFWSMSMSEELLRSGGASFLKLRDFHYGRSDDSDYLPTRGKRIKGDSRTRLSPDESSSGLDKISVSTDESSDGPLVARHRVAARYRPYTRSSRRLLLPPESDAAVPITEGAVAARVSDILADN